MRFFRLLVRLFSVRRPAPVRQARRRRRWPWRARWPQVFSPKPTSQPQAATAIQGRCWVIDGDTIVIGKSRVRLAGIDAPELDHPWGKQSKWALVQLCKGQTVTAVLRPELSYDRLVAECFLPDGRDLAAELVSSGLALDWPKFSGGKYRHLEPPGARRKLWLAHARQSGELWPRRDF